MLLASRGGGLTTAAAALATSGAATPSLGAMDRTSRLHLNEETAFLSLPEDTLSSMWHHTASAAGGRAPHATADGSGSLPVVGGDGLPDLADSSEVRYDDANMAEDDSRQMYSVFMNPASGPWDHALLETVAETHGGTVEDSGSAGVASSRQPFMFPRIDTSLSLRGGPEVDCVKAAATTIDRGLVSDSPVEGAAGPSGHAVAPAAPAVAAGAWSPASVALAQGLDGQWPVPPAAVDQGMGSLQGGECTAGDGGSGASKNFWGVATADGGRGRGDTALDPSQPLLVPPLSGCLPATDVVDASDEALIPMAVSPDVPGGMDGAQAPWTVPALPYGPSPPWRADAAGLSQVAGPGGLAATAAKPDAARYPSTDLLYALAETARHVADCVDPALAVDSMGSSFEAAMGHPSSALAWREADDAVAVAPLHMSSAVVEARGPLVDVNAAAAGGGRDDADDIQLAFVAATTTYPQPPSVAQTATAAAPAWAAAAYPTTEVLSGEGGPADGGTAAAVTAMLVDPSADGREPSLAGGGALGGVGATAIDFDDAPAVTAANAVAGASAQALLLPSFPCHPPPPVPLVVSSPPPPPAEPSEEVNRRRAAARTASARSRLNSRNTLNDLLHRADALPASSQRIALKQKMDAALAIESKRAEAIWNALPPPSPLTGCKHTWLLPTRGAELARLKHDKILAMTQLKALQSLHSSEAGQGVGDAAAGVDDRGGGGRSNSGDRIPPATTHTASLEDLEAEVTKLNNAIKLVGNQRSSFVVKLRTTKRKRLLQLVLDGKDIDADSDGIDSGSDSCSNNGGNSSCSDSGNGGIWSGNHRSGNGNGHSGTGGADAAARGMG
ncbi:hypothetical protein MMPV_006425 [Pyropia vietnamensis]